MPSKKENYKSEDPETIQYIRLMRCFMRTIGGWPEEKFGRKLPLIQMFQRRTLPFQVFMILVGASYYLVHNYSRLNFFDVGHVLITSFLCIVMVARTALSIFNGNVIVAFLEFHLVHHKHKGNHYERIWAITEKISHYFALYQLFMMFCSVSLFNIAPIYNNYKMGYFSRTRPENMSVDFAVFFAYPGYVQKDHYWLTVAINTYCSFNCGTTICHIDLMLSLMVFQIIGHIKTLMLDLETMLMPKVTIDVLDHFNYDRLAHTNVKAVVEKFDEEENKTIHIKLVEMINHHRQIVRFADHISTFFGPMLALNYLFHLVSLCILLLECSRRDTDALARFGPLTIIIFGQLIQLSAVFEIVGYMSEKLIDSVYFVPWECMDIRNQRSVRFLLNRIQTPIQLTAMGIVPVGVQTMRAFYRTLLKHPIIKTTLSFFAFLQSMNEF